METFRKIPLVNDIITDLSAGNIQLKDLYNYFDGDMLDMFLKYNERPSDEKILNYIEFVNKTSLDSSYYKDIIKFIDEKNIDKVLGTFDNNDIKDELFPLIPYELASSVWGADDLKEVWLIKNKEWITNNRDKMAEYLAYDYYHIYYRINGEIFTSNPHEIKETYGYVSDVERNIEEGTFDVAKYILENISKSKERSEHIPNYEFDDEYKEMLTMILNNEYISKIQVDIIKLLLLNMEYFDMEMILRFSYNNNYELFKFLYEVFSEYLREVGVLDGRSKIMIQNSEYKKFIKNHDVDIEKTDLLYGAINDNDLDKIIYLINKGVEVTVPYLILFTYINGPEYEGDEIYRFLLGNCEIKKEDEYILNMIGVEV